MGIVSAMMQVGAAIKHALFKVTHSLRFESLDADFLTQPNQVTATDSDKWTLSVWIKVASNGGLRTIISGGENHAPLYLDANDNLAFYEYNGSSVQLQFNTNETIKVADGWAHVVMSVDYASSATNFGDKVKVWIDGTAATLNIPTPPSSWNLHGNNTSALNGPTYTQYPYRYIGRKTNSLGRYFPGQMSEFHFVDGQALDASYFGETNASGQWVPKEVTGVTYGTNGFYLDFADSSTASALGTDATTNGNDFTVNGNITPDDQLIDSPNLRFATLDPSNKGTNVTLSEANLKAAKSNAGFEGVRSTQEIPASPKIYAEYLLDNAAGAICGVGNGSASVTSYVGSDVHGWGWQPTSGPKVWHGANYTSYGPQTATNDVVMIAVDRVAGKVYWGVNGGWITSSGATNTDFAYALEGASDTDITNASSLYFMYSGQNNQTAIWNFGQDHTFAGAKSPLSSPKTDDDGSGEFYYQPPTGFKALATSY